jgi:HAD superfamily phosphoserine phosphatase-like hydrolase
MVSKRRFAVFDIDGTIYRGNLTWDFFNKLIRANLIPSNSLDQLEAFYVAHDTRMHDNSYRDYDKKLIEVFCDSLLKLENMEQYWAIGIELANETSKRSYKYSKELLAQLKEKNYYLIAITNAVGAVAIPYSKLLGFNAIDANEELIDDSSGMIIDWAINRRGPTKAEVLKSLIINNGLSYKSSYGIGDTMSDFEMLEIVENPIVFNPEKNLQSLAIQKGWQIIVERKNVIYHLENSDSNFILKN